MLSLVERACSMQVEHRAELKLSHHLPNWWHMFNLFQDFFLAFFYNWKWNFGTSKPASSNRRTTQWFVNISGTASYVTKTWAEVKILISFPMHWVESHISHCSWVLWRCPSEQSSYSGEFGCHSFITHSPWTACFLPCHAQKLACFNEP